MLSKDVKQLLGDGNVKRLDKVVIMRDQNQINVRDETGQSVFTFDCHTNSASLFRPGLWEHEIDNALKERSC